MKITHPTIILLASLFTGLMQTSHAHDPGLSFAKVQVLDDAIHMHISIAEQDIESLIAVDLNHDDLISPAEFERIQLDLGRIIAGGIDLRLNNAPSAAAKLSVAPGSSETIKVKLVFPYQGQDKINLAVPLITRFANGHRQHLTVLDRGGSTQFQKVLSAASEPVLISSEYEQHRGIFRQYFIEGVWHIWIGFDHILFLVTLLLPAVLIFRGQQWHSVHKLLPALIDTLKIVTAFTLAHSITLGLAVFEIVRLPSNLVESAIAFSVLVVALNNLRPVIPGPRWSLAFAFGLIHGFGFANVLTDLGLPAGSLLLSLAGFNLGVEAGQFAIVVLLLPLTYMIRSTLLYRKWIFSGGSVAAALIASVWMTERITGVEVVGL